jgi:hypothetical protein
MTRQSLFLFGCCIVYHVSPRLATPKKPPAPLTQVALLLICLNTRLVSSSRYDWDGPPTPRALLALQPVPGHPQPPALDQQLATRRTIGVLVPMPQHVAQVDEVQPLLSADFVGPFQDVQ